MKINNTRWIFKTLSSKLLFLFWFSFLLIGIVYAGLFSPLPLSPFSGTPWITFSGRLAKISSVTCPSAPVQSFIKGFDAEFNPICVPYNAPNPNDLILADTGVQILGYPTVAPTGEMPGGKFGTYFKNIVNYCADWGVLRGFTRQGQKICVDASNSSRVITPLITHFGTSNVQKLSTPSWESLGGKFQLFFDRMFTVCPVSQGIKGFGTDGTPLCADIPVGINCTPITVAPYGNLPSTPVNGICSCDIWPTALTLSGLLLKGLYDPVYDMTANTTTVIDNIGHNDPTRAAKHTIIFSGSGSCSLACADPSMTVSTDSSGKVMCSACKIPATVTQPSGNRVYIRDPYTGIPNIPSFLKNDSGNTCYYSTNGFTGGLSLTGLDPYVTNMDATQAAAKAICEPNHSNYGPNCSVSTICNPPSARQCILQGLSDCTTPICVDYNICWIGDWGYRLNTYKTYKGLSVVDSGPVDAYYFSCEPYSNNYCSSNWMGCGNWCNCGWGGGGSSGSAGGGGTQ